MTARVNGPVPTRPYFDGRPQGELRLDHSLIPPFQDRCSPRRRPSPGEIRTYGQVAVPDPSPRAARATGCAVGLDRKRILLDHRRSLAGKVR